MSDIKICRTEQWEYTASSKFYDMSATGAGEQSAELKLCKMIIKHLEKERSRKIPFQEKGLTL